MKPELIRTAMAVGEDGVERLSDSSVIIFGLGGVGSYVFEALCRAGVGRLTLVDGDTVSLSNINRQLCALHSTVGMNKTDVLAARAKDINPDCEVKVISEFLTADNADMFFSERYDFCVDAIDDTSAKKVIAVKCAEKNIPLIASMGTGNKIYPELFRITDISKTEYCPLCKKMRRLYREAGVKKVTVLFSTEQPREVMCEIPQEETTGRRPPSSVSFVPGTAGLMIAGHVVRFIVCNKS